MRPSQLPRFSLFSGKSPATSHRAQGQLVSWTDLEGTHPKSTTLVRLNGRVGREKWSFKGEQRERKEPWQATKRAGSQSGAA